ncbi:MAG: patatin-like phospholipase family protein [Salibacteraceae bacterium]|jgi:NTE family protein|nr:patatin-like phospholipase family protein [Salibacteraceae bacterium]MDP4687409.1 patatin-like phospholipase family protein [Salibacteraceae bacterium]MDP4965755.1 patatin-like phospholipase family protein [Salibacteraceae bacterium]
MKYKLGIALGGGGARGFAHLGAIKALAEKGLEADIYAGTSAGAIVGSFLASGLAPDEVFELMHKNKFSDYTKLHLPIDGFMSLEGMQAKLETYIKAKNLEDLNKPLIVCASNINTGKVAYFEKGKLSSIVAASSSIPVLFSPIKIGKHQYLDGGVFDNVPVAALRNVSDKVIAINIMPLETNSNVKNLMDVALRTFQMSVEANTIYSRKSADLFIEMEGIQKFGVLSSANAQALFDLGYSYTKALDIEL